MKKVMLLLVMLVGIVTVGNAGLYVSGTDLIYEVDGNEPSDLDFSKILYLFYKHYEPPLLSSYNKLLSPIEAGDFSMISSIQPQSVSISAGGSAGTQYATFNIEGASPEIGDKLVLDLTQFRLEQAPYTVKVTIDSRSDFFCDVAYMATDEPTPTPTVEPMPEPTVEPTPEPTVAPTPPVDPSNPSLRRVPTLSEWGFLLTAMMVLGIGVLSIGKKFN